MLITLCSDKQGKTEISADICTDSPELTQFGMYIKIGNKQYPVSYCGTSGKTKRISCIAELPEGNTDAVLAFSRTNTADTMLKALEIKNV